MRFQQTEDTVWAWGPQVRNKTEWGMTVQDLLARDPQIGGHGEQVLSAASLVQIIFSAFLTPS